MADLIIENLVLSTEINQSLNLENINTVFSDSSYDPEQVPAVIVNFNNPSRVVFITTQGKIVCTGSKSEDDAKQALEDTINTLKENEIIDDSFEMKVMIESIVVLKKLDVSLPLSTIQIQLPANQCIYEPSTHPWIEYHTPTYSMLLFSCGDIICSGNISLEESKEAFQKIEDTLTSIGCNVNE